MMSGQGPSPDFAGSGGRVPRRTLLRPPHLLAYESKSMARANLLNTRTTNLLDLVGNGRLYRVPPYQRDYSWEVEQWEDLWNDILELRGRPDDRHYMGALVAEGKSDREF